MDSRDIPEALAQPTRARLFSLLQEFGRPVATSELAELLGAKVHLFIHVKVDEQWAESREIYEEIGLEWVK